MFSIFYLYFSDRACYNETEKKQKCKRKVTVRGVVISMKRIRISLLVFLCFLCLGGGTLRTEAASFNLVKQVSAKTPIKGKWVKTDKGYRYRYTHNGKYARSVWLPIKKRIYYFNSKSYRVTGLKKYKGKKYYLNSRGALTSGWQTIGKKTYYFSARTGAALTGWQTIQKVRYYFNENGVQQKNCWVGDYYVGQDGTLVRDTMVDGYYVDENGKRTVVHFEDGDPKEETSQYIFVGDSRTVGMKNTVGGNHVYIGKVGEGYQWFSTKGIRTLKKALKAAPQSKVIINLGVNDLGNISSYIAYYQNLIVQYPGARFYFMSVNPIEAKLAKARGYNTTAVNNNTIKAFNASLQAAFPGAYLDCYTYLMTQNLIRNVKAGAGTVDGIHYTAAVYQAIYNFAIASTN